MPGKAARLIITERQQEILRDMTVAVLSAGAGTSGGHDPGRVRAKTQLRDRRTAGLRTARGGRLATALEGGFRETDPRRMPGSSGRSPPDDRKGVGRRPATGPAKPVRPGPNRDDRGGGLRAAGEIRPAHLTLDDGRTGRRGGQTGDRPLDFRPPSRPFFKRQPSFNPTAAVTGLTRRRRTRPSFNARSGRSATRIRRPPDVLKTRESTRFASMKKPACRRWSGRRRRCP